MADPPRPADRGLPQRAPADAHAEPDAGGGAGMDRALRDAYVDAARDALYRAETDRIGTILDTLATPITYATDVYTIGERIIYADPDVDPVRQPDSNADAPPAAADCPYEPGSNPDGFTYTCPYGHTHSASGTRTDASADGDAYAYRNARTMRPRRASERLEVRRSTAAVEVKEAGTETFIELLGEEPIEGDRQFPDGYWTKVVFRTDTFKGRGKPDDRRILVAFARNSVEGYALSSTPEVDGKTGTVAFAYKAGLTYDVCSAYIALKGDWETPISNVVSFSLPL